MEQAVSRKEALEDLRVSAKELESIDAGAALVIRKDVNLKSNLNNPEKPYLLVCWDESVTDVLAFCKPKTMAAAALFEEDPLGLKGADFMRRR